MKTIKLLSLAMLFSIAFTSCSDDDDAPIPVNEEEVITTMTIELVPQGGGNTVTIQTRDADGDGPDDPVITGGTLMANTTYSANIELLDETNPNDIENITEEVEEEDDEHQFFFATDVGTVSYLDFDGDGNPIGLQFELVTTNATTGNLTVILRHEPNKAAEGVSDGNIANAGGETDIETTFPIVVQ